MFHLTSTVRGLYSKDVSGQLSVDFSTWSLQQLPWQSRLYPPSQVLRIRHLGLNWGNLQNINTIENAPVATLIWSSLQSCVFNATILPEESNNQRFTYFNELPLVSLYGDLAQRKIDYWRTNKVKNLKKIANPQALSIEYFVFSSFSLKFSHYTVLFRG
jgi:hypothetical protein